MYLPCTWSAGDAQADDEQQRYVLFSTLLRHARGAGLAPAERAAVLRLAAAQGRAVGPALAPLALVLALRVCKKGPHGAVQK